MKAYSIGRDHGCDIVINDNTDIISRRHAVINVSATGKITIIDQSSNGTYVNGIRVSPNVPVPITRKDVISFAHVSQLDWGRVPSSNIWMRYSIMAVLTILLVTGGVFGYQFLTKDSSKEDTYPATVTDTIKEKEQLEDKKDTISPSIPVVNDNDTIKDKVVPEKETPKRRKRDDKKEEVKEEENTEKTSGNRPIG